MLSLHPPLLFHTLPCAISSNLMPQVDLETLLCGGETKVSCETMIAGADPPPASKLPEEDPDMPAESIQLRIGEEIDWTDINAVYERDDSTKGNTNPKFKQQQQQQQQQQQHQPPTNSQRFSGNLKPKAPIIGLPNKVRHSGYLGASARRLPKGRTLLKKKKGNGDRKSAVPPPEPGSPKVSCFGKVLSERERERSHHIRPALAQSAAVEEKESRHRRSAGGCFARLMGMFRCGRLGNRGCEEEDEEEEDASTPPEKIFSWSEKLPAAAAEVVAPAGLGAVRRFSSGRRAASWGGEEDGDGQMHVAASAPLDPVGVMGRRSVG